MCWTCLCNEIKKDGLKDPCTEQCMDKSCSPPSIKCFQNCHGNAVWELDVCSHWWSWHLYLIRCSLLDLLISFNMWLSLLLVPTRRYGLKLPEMSCHCSCFHFMKRWSVFFQSQMSVSMMQEQHLPINANYLHPVETLFRSQLKLVKISF